MLRKLLVIAGLGLLMLPAAAQAQFDSGDWELTLTGSGSSDNDFDNNNFGADVSLGYFLTDSIEVALRQGVGISHTNVGGDDDTNTDGSTRVAADLHFDLDRWQPFLGGNIGYLYGDTTEDSFIAGPEGGVKFFVNSTTFIFGMVEYQFIFEDEDDADEAFDDGRFVYSLGIGFRF